MLLNTVLFENWDKMDFSGLENEYFEEGESYSSARGRLPAGVKRVLSPLQKLYVKAYIKYDGNMILIGKAIQRSPQHIYSMARSKIVQMALEAEIDRTGWIKPEMYKKPLELVAPKADLVQVPKEDRLRVLWVVANKGVELIYDKEGNEVMASPATSVSAIRTINEMLPGSLAPRETIVDVNVVVEDKRTEAELAQSIGALMDKYNELRSVTDAQVDESRALPDITEVIEHGKDVELDT